MNGPIRTLVALAWLLVVLPAPAAQAARTSQSPDPVVEPVGQHGGVTRAILADGERLLLGPGTRVAEVDVSDRAAPRLVGHGAMLDGVVAGIARAGEHLVVVTAASLYVLDAGAPLRPPLGSVPLELPAVRVVASGRYAYAFHQRLGALPGAGEGVIQTVVSVVDLEDPASPRFLEPVALPANVDVQDVVRAGRLLAIATTDDANARDEAQQRALVVYDLADPAVPRQLGQVVGPAWGRLATPDPDGPPIVAGVGIGALVLDLGNPGQPRTLARYPEARIWGRLRDIAVTATADGRPYAAFNGGFAFGVVAGGIEGPAALEWSTTATTAGVPAGGLAAVGEHLYVSEAGGRISALLAPAAQAGRTLGALDLIGTTTAVAVDRSRPDVAFVAADQGGLGAVRLPPEAIEPLGYAFDGHYHGWLDVAGAHAVVNDGGSGDVVGLDADVYDIALPDRPRKVGRFQTLQWVYEIMLEPASGTAFARAYEDGVWRVSAWDLANPASPRRGGDVAVPGAVTDMDLDGDRLAVVGYAPPATPDAPSEPVLTLVDVSTPLAPRLVRTLRFGAAEGDAYDLPLVAVAGRNAFVATVVGIGASARYRLYAVDLEAAGGALGNLLVPGPISGLVAADGIAFLTPDCPASPAACAVTAVDVRDPARMREAARIGLGAAGGRTSVAAIDGTVLIASGARGLEAFRPDLPWAFPTPPPTLTPAPTEPVTATATRTITPTPRPTRTQPATPPTARPSPTRTAMGPVGAPAYLPWAGREAGLP